MNLFHWLPCSTNSTQPASIYFLYVFSLFCPSWSNTNEYRDYLSICLTIAFQQHKLCSIRFSRMWAWQLRRCNRIYGCNKHFCLHVQYFSRMGSISISSVVSYSIHWVYGFQNTTEGRYLDSAIVLFTLNGNIHQPFQRKDWIAATFLQRCANTLKFLSKGVRPTRGFWRISCR